MVIIQSFIGNLGSMIKKRVAIHTDHSSLFTGFSKFKRALLRYLYKTGKYEIFEFSNGIQHGAPELSRLPWPCFTTLPAPEQQQQINSIQDNGQRDNAQRQANYGRYGVPKLLRENKIDVFLSHQDSWGVDFLPNLPEVQNTTFIPHVTIDSEFLIPSQIDLAGSVDKLYAWASFALREYEKHGYNNVEFLPGCVDSSNFFPLEDDKRKELRQTFGLNDSFSIIYVFRSQLRKLVPNLLDGFKLFKEKYPESKAKLILVTSAQEGWNIPELIRQRNIDERDVYFCYYCKNCKHYELRPFSGHDLNCPHCGAQKIFNTINIIHGISEEQLNECYNCADMFCSVMTSGGMEISPSIEAKCAGLSVACTGYSCGEDIIGDDRGGINIEYEKYYEFGSSFVKSSSQGYQVSDAIEKIWLMGENGRKEFGLIGRKFVQENLAPEIIGKKFEELIDAAPYSNWDDWTPPPKNPSHIPPDNLSPQDFVLDLFKNILRERVGKNNSQVKHWVEHLIKSNDYQGVYNHFVNLAVQHNNQLSHKSIDFSELLDPSDEKRLLVVMPESAGDVILINSLIPRLAKLYPEFRIYFATKPQFRELVEHLPEIHRVLDYLPAMDDIFAMTGRGSHKGFFDYCFLPHGQTQRFFQYQQKNNELRREWL